MALVVVTASVVGAGELAARHAPARPHPRETAPAAVSATAPETVARPTAPHIAARSAIVVDLRTDRLLFAKHAAQRRPVASLAKIMTAMLVLERSKLSDVERVGKAATQTEAINVGLARGERITVRNLLYGLLLWSGNDTAVALAQHVSGTVRAFVSAMNAKARVLGLSRTEFLSPNGLDDRAYSTAADVAELTRQAMSDPTFARLVGTQRHRIPGPRTQIHRLRNLNRMLFQYPGATGVKTGYTRAAGTCVVTSASRGGLSLLAVVLGDRIGDSWRTAYRDSANLLDYGFALERGSSTR